MKGKKLTNFIFRTFYDGKAKGGILMKKWIKMSLCMMIGFFCFSFHVKAMNVEARIQDQNYETFQAALEDVLTGNQKGPIYLMEDVTLDIGTINKDVEIIGNYHQITVPLQSQTDDSESQGRLNVQATLTFNQCRVHFDNTYQNGNNTWSVVLSSQGVLEFINDSNVTFVGHGIYASNGSIINVDRSKVSLSQMEYTSMMAESYGNLNIKNDSNYTIDHAVESNGITGFHVFVDHSSLSVENCLNQAMVKGNLTITHQGNVSFSKNDVGYNMYSENNLYVDETSSLKMNENKNCALLSQGRKKRTITIKNGGSLEAKYNGINYQASDDEDKYYAQTSAFNFGVYGWYENAQKILLYPNLDDVVFEDGAKVTISNNYTRGISNYGNLYLGKQTVITHNGGYQQGESLQTCRIGKGGGIYNAGTVTLFHTTLYNNHARLSGDDFYSEEGGTVHLSFVSNDWILDDCQHSIDGWYDDGLQQRWNGDDKEHPYLSLIEGQKDYHFLEAKAAHGVIQEEIKEDDSKDDSKEEPKQDEKESEIRQTNEKITPVKTVRKQNVQTGDESNGALWLTFMGLALLLIFLLVIKYIKGKRD